MQGERVLGGGGGRDGGADGGDGARTSRGEGGGHLPPPGANQNGDGKGDGSANGTPILLGVGSGNGVPSSGFPPRRKALPVENGGRDDNSKLEEEEVGEKGDAGEEEDAPKERVTKLLLILKWGGELTKLGERQAKELGNSFRSILYPDMGCGGLLRLHR